MSLSSIEWSGRYARRLGPLRSWGLGVDVPLLLALAAIAGIGAVVLYSASGANGAMVMRQGVRFLVGLGAFLVMAQIPPRYLRIWTPWLFCASLALLVLVMLVGVEEKGAQRWLDLGLIRFQPSEIMKLAAPMMVAWFMHERRLPPTLGQLLVMTLIVAAPALLIARQPDLGTAMLVMAAGGMAILLAGVSLRVIGSLLVIGLISAPLLWHRMLDYQRARIFIFLNPESDPLGTGYNIIQSKIAIGSGGLFGKGWLNGTQAHLEFLPERSTDFIFAVLGEEFGLLGLMALLVLYLVLVGRGLYIAADARDTFSRLLAGALSLTFFFSVFVNAGMVCGLLPIVGVPLPLVSAGGTSLVTLMAGFGMLAAIHTHRKFLAP